MALAMLTGSGWPAQRATVPGLTAVAERNVVLAGGRGLEPHQRVRLEAAEVRVVGEAYPVAMATSGPRDPGPCRPRFSAALLAQSRVHFQEPADVAMSSWPVSV